MYEHMTYEKIFERVLERIPDDMDKREGSVIYDAVAPVVLELTQMYVQLDVVLKESFGDTASRDFLIRRASERGIKPRPASRAVVKGEFNINVETGTRFRSGLLTYVVTESNKLECEQFGRIGNKSSGTLIPIDYVDGLGSAKITELLIPGEDEEETEDFRKRYTDSFQSRPFGGNVDDYLKKTNSIAGVGATKVTPIWNGGGTVKLTILNSEYEKASDELVRFVQREIDPTMDASGIGIAPIGHIVTVDTAEEVVVDVVGSITLQDGYTFDRIKSKLLGEIGQYLLELKRQWEKQDSMVIRLSQIEAKMINVEGIVDIENTKINGSTSNLVLSKYQIPKLGEVVNE